MEFGGEDLEFAWIEDIELDQKSQSEIDDRSLKNMSSTIDEVRDRRGEDPLPDGLGAKPYFYASDAAIPIDQMAELVDLKLNPPAPPPQLDENGKPIAPAAANAPPAPAANGAKAGDKSAESRGAWQSAESAASRLKKKA
jgi:hypothetical protein